MFCTGARGAFWFQSVSKWAEGSKGDMYGRKWSSGGELWWERVFSAVGQFGCKDLNLQASINVQERGGPGGDWCTGMEEQLPKRRRGKCRDQDVRDCGAAQFAHTLHSGRRSRATKFALGNFSEIGYESLLTDDPEEAVRLVQSGACRVILADVHLSGIHAYEFLDRLLRVDPGIHVIIISQEYTLESALEAIRRGATDFLPKPLDRLRLKRALDDVALLYDQRRRVRALEEQLLRDLEFHGIVGKSPVMLEVFDFARKVARHYTNVLLVGPTGTGKELVARTIHS